MGEALLTMRAEERERLWVVRARAEGKLRGMEAAERLEVTERQVRRLVRGLREGGDAVAIHGLRGQPGNRSIAAETKRRVLRLHKTRYDDYGPTLLAERLAEPPHGIRVGRETLRRWLVAEGRWEVRRRRRGRHPWRERRARFGELVQLDTSIHDWFEGRGEKAVLVAGIDDATGHVFGLFAGGDTVLANFAVIRGWVERYGRPLGFYVDRHTHFSVADEAGCQRPESTQIGRAFGELGVEMVTAHSPQAKGRVERLFRTLQDRLVKALRERGIGTIEEANRYAVEEYWGVFNDGFERVARDPHDAHRPLSGEQRRRLREIFSVREERTVRPNLTIQYLGHHYLLETRSDRPLYAKLKVEVAIGAGGEMRVLHQGRDVAFREVALDRFARPKRPVVRARQVLDSVAGQAPRASHPWRRMGRFPAGHRFGPPPAPGAPLERRPRRTVLTS